jgi:hypothetical protein
MTQIGISIFALSGLMAGVTAACGNGASSTESKEVFVPSREFISGADCDSLQAEPACDRALYPVRFTVTINSFYVDRNPVTRAEYGECVQTKACPDELKPAPPFVDPEARRYLESLARTTYRGAKAYCRWRHKSLPTANEFERIARGTDGRVEPWGTGESPCAESQLSLRCLTHKGPAGARSVAFVRQWVDWSADHSYPDGMIRGVNQFTFQAFSPDDSDPHAFFRCARFSTVEH